MIVRPELRALRCDDTPQRHAQARMVAVLAQWRTTPAAASAGAELARFAAGSPLGELPLLAALFTPGDAAAATFTGALMSALIARLAADPLGQVPLRHYADDMLASLMLARSGMATLSLQATDGPGLSRRPAPVSVSFCPSETYEHVLAGQAAAERIELRARRPAAAADLTRVPFDLRAGMVCHRHGAREALLLHPFTGSLVTLKLQRRSGPGEVTREYRLADGALVHQAAGNPRDSRLELTAALLGRMGRGDAAPLLAAMAEEQGSAALRWQALRECLGLDSAAGFRALCTIAARADDPLAAPAGALRAQLLETYPALAGAA